jgi:hypothetical protein
MPAEPLSRELPAVLDQQEIEFLDEVLLLQAAERQVVAGEIDQTIGSLVRHDLEAGLAERYDDRRGLFDVVLVEERLVNLSVSMIAWAMVSRSRLVLTPALPWND